MTATSARRTESSFEGARGDQLVRRAWLPTSEPYYVIALVHGFAEHSARYDHFGEWFATRDAAVHSYDQIGHGRSPGSRNYVARFGWYLDDLDRFLACVRSDHPGLPLVLIGHSMGALVSAAYASERSPRISQLVLSGLPLAAKLAGWQRAMAKVVRLFAPRLQIASGIAADALSRDADVVRRYEEDPLVDTRMSVSLAAEMFATTSATAERIDRVEVPTLVLHGGDDPICPSDGSERFHGALRPAGCALHVYPGLRHEIFNEPEQEEIFREVDDWLRERQAATLAPGTSGQAGEASVEAARLGS